jgi:hypothetical protein
MQGLDSDELQQLAFSGSQHGVSGKLKSKVQGTRYRRLSTARSKEGPVWGEEWGHGSDMGRLGCAEGARLTWNRTSPGRKCEYPRGAVSVKRAAAALRSTVESRVPYSTSEWVRVVGTGEYEDWTWGCGHW